MPNFKNALTKANQEVNKIHQMQCQYNDYAIQSHNGRYEYLFSFKNPKQQGTYTIVSVNGQGQVLLNQHINLNNRLQPTLIRESAVIFFSYQRVSYGVLLKSRP